MTFLFRADFSLLKSDWAQNSLKIGPEFFANQHP